MTINTQHRWQKWPAWGGVRGEGQRAFCQHCGMLRTMVYEAKRLGWRSVSVPRYERGPFTQEGGLTPPCVGMFLPLKIDGFTVIKSDRPFVFLDTVKELELRA